MSAFTLAFLLLWQGPVQAKDSVTEIQISLSVQDRPLKEALRKIEMQTGLKFFYLSSQIDTDRKVTIEAQDIPLNTVLNNLFRDTGISYSFTGKQIILKRPDKGSETGSADPIFVPEADDVIKTVVIDMAPQIVSLLRLTGQVLNEERQPLPGVNVLIKGTTNGTTTDVQGNYSLEVENENATLVFSFIGYQSQEVQVSSRTVINVSMVPDVTSLAEVVVVGYGTVNKRDLTGAISSISSEQLKEVPITSLEQGIQGKVAGVHVTQASSAPGGGITIRVRGGTSINAGNEPLYVIDGFPVYNDASMAPSTVDEGVPPNPLSSINPNDIESIEVLKDASATAIYGARGANGVVIITTKRGKPGKAAITYDGYYGVQEVAKKYEMMNAQEYATSVNELAARKGHAPYLPSPESWDNNDTDWQDEIFTKAPIQNHQISVMGGDESINYAFSGNYYDQEGIVKNSGFKRYSFRLNLDKKINERFKIGNSLSINRSITNSLVTNGENSPSNGIIGAALNMLPILPIRDENGNYVYANYANNYSTRLNPRDNDNPVALTTDYFDEMVSDRVIGNIFGEYKILEGLQFRVSFGADVIKSNREIYFTRNTYYGSIKNEGGYARTGYSEKTSFLNENILSYTKRFNDTHDLNVTLGYTWQNELYKSHSLVNINFITDIMQNAGIESGNREGGPSIGAGEQRSDIVSWVGRANYIFKDKYLFTVTGRMDGSSKFGAGNKWGFFPSGAFAWRISDENFMANNRVFSDVKLRLSYGVTGNTEIGTYRSLAGLDDVRTSFNGNPVIGFVPNSLGNPDLKWETTTQFDAGLDIGLIKDRLSINMDYYIKNTDDLLLEITLPISSGFTRALKNSGSVQNKGIELGISGKVLVNAFKWDTHLNLSANRNMVTDLGESDRFFGAELPVKFISATLVQEGYPLGAYYGWKVDGVIRDEADLEAYKPGGEVGDYKFADLNDDGKIDADDRMVLGNPYPDLIYGWSNSFEYKNFSLNVFLQGVEGMDVLNINLIRLENLAIKVNNTKRRFTERWTPENPDAKFPKFGPGGQAVEANEMNSRVVEDGSHLRMKALTLGYTVPLKSNRINTLKFYATAKNLFTITNYSGYNPEVNSRGQNNVNRNIDWGSYPLDRSYLFGVNLSF